MRLILVRHAEAAPGEPDALRPLTPGGRTSARALGARLAVERPDAVVSSPLLRARETADQIARAAGVVATVDERLAPGATASGLREVIGDLGATVVVVGHQPDCSEILVALGGEDRPFAPGAAAVIEL